MTVSADHNAFFISNTRFSQLNEGYRATKRTLSHLPLNFGLKYDKNENLSIMGIAMASRKILLFCVALLCVSLLSGTLVAEQAWFFDDGAEWQETRWDPQWRTDPNWYPDADDIT